jgi:hypothetical protein
MINIDSHHVSRLVGFYEAIGLGETFRGRPARAAISQTAREAR